MARRMRSSPALLCLCIGLVTWVAPNAAIASEECRSKVPMPGDTSITPPAADVPPHIARFSGAWNGVWFDRKGRPALCASLIVEEVHPNGFAQVVYG